jgi:hypothetical protein
MIRLPGQGFAEQNSAQLCIKSGFNLMVSL